MLVLVTIVTLLCATAQVSSLLLPVAEQGDVQQGANPEVFMTTEELITSKGYPVERHDVVTEDGYILGLFRIPHGVNNKDKEDPRPVVLLQHGLAGICDNFLVNLANESLAFILADAGADVWLSNSRGNAHSKRHISLDPKSREFWKFSYDEMAQYDLPANIYYILNQTNHEQLYYVGHSQGTAIGFARFGEDQELASRIKHFIALAPIGRVGHNRSALRLLVPFSSEVMFFLNLFGHGEFAVPATIQRAMAAVGCQGVGAELCMNVGFLLCGYNPDSYNLSRADVYQAHGPGGSSALNVLQWAQNVKSMEFQRFDYGAQENIQRYGQATPPAYDPSKVKVPVAIFRGGQDLLADNTDVEWLLPQLNVTHDVYIPFYEHLDLVFGYDAVNLMYPELLKIIFGN